MDEDDQLRMRIPGKWLPDNQEPQTVGSIYTVIPGYKNSGRPVRVIGTTSGRDQYDVEDVLTEEVFRIQKKQIQGRNANKRPDPYPHASLHAILQVGFYEDELKRHIVLRNNDVICREFLQIDPQTQEPVSWERAPTFYVFRSLLQKVDLIEPGNILCVVADQNISTDDLVKLREFMEIDPETFPQRFIRFGLFEDREYPPGGKIQLSLSMGEDENTIVSSDVDDLSQSVYSILTRRATAGGVKIFEMDRIFTEMFL